MNFNPQKYRTAPFILGLIALILLTLSLTVAAQNPVFIRGDIDDDGDVDGDDFCLMQCILFGGTCGQTGTDCSTVSPSCMFAADFNDDGNVTLSDATSMYYFITGQSSAPPPPYPDCGEDPTNPQPGADCCQWSSSGCCIGIRGNANGDPDEKVIISDVTFLINYLFGQPNGPAPACAEEGNANGDPDGKIIISDVTYLINYLFGQPNGPEPPPCP